MPKELIGPNASPPSALVFRVIFRDGRCIVKRLFGWVLTVFGGGAALWGIVAALTGTLKTEVSITPDLAVNAMTGGLIGLAALTLGLVWVRD